MFMIVPAHHYSRMHMHTRSHRQTQFCTLTLFVSPLLSPLVSGGLLHRDGLRRNLGRARRSDRVRYCRRTLRPLQGRRCLCRPHRSMRCSAAAQASSVEIHAHRMSARHVGRLFCIASMRSRWLTYERCACSYAFPVIQHTRKVRATI